MSLKRYSIVLAGAIKGQMKIHIRIGESTHLYCDTYNERIIPVEHATSFREQLNYLVGKDKKLCKKCEQMIYKIIDEQEQEVGKPSPSVER